LRQARVRQPPLPPLPRSCATTTTTKMTTTQTTTLDVGLLGKLKKQWLDFKSFINVVGDARAATSSDKAKPARYWIRMRPFWKELLEMMLFWLAVPISTACVERGFSHMTGMDANVLWRRLQELRRPHNLMVHLHREWLRAQLRVAL